MCAWDVFGCSSVSLQNRDCVESIIHRGSLLWEGANENWYRLWKNLGNSGTNKQACDGVSDTVTKWAAGANPRMGNPSATHRNGLQREF